MEEQAESPRPTGPAMGPRARVLAMLDAGTSLSRVAIESGNSKRDLQAWLDSKPCSTKVENRIGVWFEEMDLPGDDGEPSLVETKASARISGALDFARNTPSIALIYGGPGLGKTTTAVRNTKDHQSAKAWTYYVSVSKWMKTPSLILEAIGETMGAYGDAHRSASLAQAVLRKLRPGDLLIIDEAQHLDSDALDGVRYFFDVGGVGIAYLGNDAVYSRLRGKSGNRTAIFAQLSSRVGMRVHVTTPEDDDIDAVLASWKVRGVRERQYGQEICRRPGGFRTLTQVLRQARIIARSMQSAIDLRVMTAAARSLGDEE